jgi:ArsR family transcriptional regulator
MGYPPLVGKTGMPPNERRSRVQDFLTIVKALADEHRVRALLAIRRQPLCHCQIVELLGLAPSTVSRHMSILRGAGLVDSWKEGRWVYYRLSGPEAPPAVSRAISWLVACAADDPVILRDAQHLSEIVANEAACRECGPAPADCGCADAAQTVPRPGK